METGINWGEVRKELDSEKTESSFQIMMIETIGMRRAFGKCNTVIRANTTMRGMT